MNAPTPASSPRFTPVAFAAIALYLVLYAASLVQLERSPMGGGDGPIVFLVFGVLFSAIAWAVTRGVVPVQTPVERPGRESLAILGYLAVFAVVFLGWGLSALKDAAPDGAIEETAVLIAKVLAMVALPALLFRRLGYTFHELFGPLSRGRLPNKRLSRAFWVMAVLFLGVQLFASSSPAGWRAFLQESGWSPVQLVLLAPLAFAWMAVEAGLTEEFLFRVLLQTRLAALLRSEIAAILGMAVVFGLAHAPGLVMRGAHVGEGLAGAPDALTAMAYTIAVHSPIGLVFGVLWMRTRSLLLVVLVHGWIDLFPNLVPMARAWFG